MLNLDRVYAKISPEPNSGCWLWTGAISDTGYANASLVINGKRVTKNIHRLLYQLERGPIASGLQIDHLCRNRGCVNPDHLDLVTPRENTMRGAGPKLAAEYQRAKTHCPQGHEYSEGNLYIYKGRKGNDCRGCCECRRMSVRKYRAKRV